MTHCTTAVESTFSRSVSRRVAAERRIAIALVTEALDRGYAISVNDGEDWVLKRSTDKRVIVGALFTTDEDQIVIRDGDGLKAGAFSLVYGNDGFDVIADQSDNDVCQAIAASIRPLVDQVERELS